VATGLEAFEKDVRSHSVRFRAIVIYVLEVIWYGPSLSRQFTLLRSKEISKMPHIIPEVTKKPLEKDWTQVEPV